VTIKCAWNTQYITAGQHSIGTLPSWMRPLETYAVAVIFGGNSVIAGRAIVGADGELKAHITASVSGIEFTMTYIV